MTRLIPLLILLYMSCATLTWALAQYAKLSALWHEQRKIYPRARPWPMALPIPASRR